MGSACSANKNSRQSIPPVQLTDDEQQQALQIRASIVKSLEDFLKMLKDNEEEYKYIIGKKQQE